MHYRQWLVSGRAKGHVSYYDYSKKTRPLSLVFGNPGGDGEGKAGGHWQSGNFKVWIKNQQDFSYGRSELGRITRHETGHVVSDAIERNISTLEHNIATGADRANTRSKAGPDFDFFASDGYRTLPPLEDKKLRYYWMREQVLSTYRKEATLPSHISEMMFKAMEQNARPKRRGSSSSGISTSRATITAYSHR